MRTFLQTNAPDADTLDVLGVRVNLVDNRQVLDFIEASIALPMQTARFTVHTGFHGLYLASKDPAFRDLCNSSDLFCPDGIAPVLIARALRKKAQRASGPELLRMFLERANETGYSSYFFGDTDETLAVLRLRLEADYPGHRVAGMYSPPFRAHSEAETDEMIAAINKARPDVLWVGLGLPKQERWIHANLHKLRVPVAAGIGAAFSLQAGTVKRAPEWVGRAGFEWLWRLAAEPRKLWRRDLVEGPDFIFTILRNWRAIRATNSIGESGARPAGPKRPR